MDEPHRRVAERIRDLAAERGLALTHLADRAGVSRAQLWNVLGGSKSPTLAWLIKIADALGVDVIELLRPAVKATRPRRA